MWHLPERLVEHHTVLAHFAPFAVEHFSTSAQLHKYKSQAGTQQHQDCISYAVAARGLCQNG